MMFVLNGSAKRGNALICWHRLRGSAFVEAWMGGELEGRVGEGVGERCCIYRTMDGRGGGEKGRKGER